MDSLLIEILLVVVIFMLSLVLYKLWRGTESTGVQLAITKAMKDVGLESSIGALKHLATDIRDNQKSLDQMLTVPTTRGAFGEISLENILISIQYPMRWQNRGAIGTSIRSEFTATVYAYSVEYHCGNIK